MSLVDAALSAVTGGGGSPDVTPGAASAWALAFYQDAPGELGEPIRTVGSDTYDGSVSATLPDDLSGGSYEIVIEGMTDEDYAAIRLHTGASLAARLHLWWKDSPSGILGDLASFTGLTDPLGAVTPKPPEHSLVAELRVDTLRRRAGERRYETVVTARERVVARLSEQRVNGLCYDGLDKAVQAVAKEAGIAVKTYGLADAVPGANDPNFASTAPGPALAAMTALADQARNALKAYGPHVAIIHDGALHVGKWPTPLPAGATRTLDEDGGLVAVDRGPDQPRDRAAGDKPPNAPDSRGTVTLTALGRPDIKPGDKLHVNLPSADFPVTQPSSLGSALLTALSGLVLGGDDPGTPATCLVGTVSHRLSRRSGFVTTVHGTVLASDSDDGWDPPQQSGTAARARPERGRGEVPPDTARAAAQRVHDVFSELTQRSGSRVGQIRTHFASSSTAPAQSSGVWYADGAPDGMPVAAQRVQVTEERHGELKEVPYLTPFAFGNCGLVLPRYPGARVLLVNAGGGPDDMVDIGALWNRDKGPPSKGGDYWLVLPVGIVNGREDVEDAGGDTAGPLSGPASHDLIDADGNRIIETKQFVVRVTDQPTDCTDRPKPGNDAPAGSVLIETKASGNAQIILKEDGTITIKGKSITIDAGSDGTISMNAKDVNVTVGHAMDVS